MSTTETCAGYELRRSSSVIQAITQLKRATAGVVRCENGLRVQKRNRLAIAVAAGTVVVARSLTLRTLCRRRQRACHPRDPRGRSNELIRHALPVEEDQGPAPYFRFFITADLVRPIEPLRPAPRRPLLLWRPCRQRTQAPEAEDGPIPPGRPCCDQGYGARLRARAAGSSPCSCPAKPLLARSALTKCSEQMPPRRWCRNPRLVISIRLPSPAPKRQG